MPLSTLSRDGLRLFAYCNRCTHNRAVAVAPLIERLGPDYPVPRVGRRMRCGGCGSRDIDTMPNWNDRTASGVQGRFNYPEWG